MSQFLYQKENCWEFQIDRPNYNWLPVCPIYVNDCTYECMNAFNLQVSLYASAILQGGIFFFLVLIRALIYDKLEGT